jgi:uncharacterized protein YceH (UPF0502 family)
VEENFTSGVEKYKQRFCNTNFSNYQFDPPQFAIVCLLLLRGPQTPGELRAHSGRLHTFADNAAVVEALAGLIEREDELKIDRIETEKVDIFFLHVGKEDRGRVLGKGGRTIGALRTFLEGVAARLDREVVVEIVD